MLLNETMNKLYEMKLTGMLKTLREQVEQGNCADLSFDERLGLLVDREWTGRQERQVTRRLKAARLRQTACMEDIDYRHPRGLDKGVLQDLASCRWIAARRNLILTGATGLGKSWIACALADRACREGYSAAYRRVPRLVQELELARGDGSYLKLLSQLARTDVLVLDDWGLVSLDGQGQHDILEVIDDRVGSRSTLLTSQLPVSKWHGTIGDPSVADAMLDRLLGSSTRIHLKGESLRKKAE